MKLALAVVEQFRKRRKAHSAIPNTLTVEMSKYADDPVDELTKKQETRETSTPQTCSITSSGSILVPSSIPLFTKMSKGKVLIEGRSREASVERIDVVGTAKIMTSQDSTNSFDGTSGPTA